MSTDYSPIREEDPMTNRLTGDYHKQLDKQYLGHWDCPPDGDLIVTIDHFEKGDVKSPNGVTQKKNICYFKNGIKPMIVNVTNFKLIAQALGSNKFEDWENQTIALFEDNVPQADDGKGLRVRPYRPKVDEYYCEDCGELITDKEVDGKTYSAKAIANNALTKFGKYLCYDCAQKRSSYRYSAPSLASFAF